MGKDMYELGGGVDFHPQQKKQNYTTGNPKSIQINIYINHQELRKADSDRPSNRQGFLEGLLNIQTYQMSQTTQVDDPRETGKGNTPNKMDRRWLPNPSGGQRQTQS